MKSKNLKLRKPMIHVKIGDLDGDTSRFFDFFGTFFLFGFNLIAFIPMIFAESALIFTPIAVLDLILALFLIFRLRIIAHFGNRVYVKTGYSGRKIMKLVNSLASSLESAAANIKPGDSSSVDEVFKLAQKLLDDAAIIVKSSSQSKGNHFRKESYYSCECQTCADAIDSILEIRNAIETAVFSVRKITKETRNLSKTQIEGLKKASKRLSDEADYISEAKREIAAL